MSSFTRKPVELPWWVTCKNKCRDELGPQGVLLLLFPLSLLGYIATQSKTDASTIKCSCEVRSFHEDHWKKRNLTVASPTTTNVCL